MSELISVKSIWILRLQTWRSLLDRHGYKWYLGDIVYSLLCYVLEVLIFLSCISPGNQLLFFILFFLLRNFLPSLFSLNKIPLPLDNTLLLFFMLILQLMPESYFYWKKLFQNIFFEMIFFIYLEHTHWIWWIV